MVNGITGGFIDYAKAVIASTGLVPSGCVFDEREKDLLWIVSSEVQGVGGLAVMVSLPSISHDERSPMAGGYKVSLTVTLRRSAVLSGVSSFEVAEALFRAFNCGKFYPGAGDAELDELNANVSVDSLRHSTRGEADALHTMTLTCYIEI